MWLTRFSIQRPIIVSMLFIALAVYGVLSYTKLGRSENPNVTFPVVVISAGYPGASPQDMERLVIKPIEDQLDGIQNLDRMSAVAQDGRAVVVVQFLLDTNLDFAAIDVQRRVDTARQYMPTDLDPPYVDKSAGDQQSPILELALASKSLSGTELSDLVDQRILPELKHIPDVQSVDSRGQVKREYHVYPDPLRMMSTTATIPDIFNALAINNANLPGGRLDSPTVETDVSVRSDITRADDMLGIALADPRRRADGIVDRQPCDRRGRPRRAARRLEVQRRARRSSSTSTASSPPTRSIRPRSRGTKSSRSPRATRR